MELVVVFLIMLAGFCAAVVSVAWGRGGAAAGLWTLAFVVAGLVAGGVAVVAVFEQIVCHHDCTDHGSRAGTAFVVSLASLFCAVAVAARAGSRPPWSG